MQSRLVTRSFRLVLAVALMGGAFLPGASAQTPPHPDRTLKWNPFAPPPLRHSYWPEATAPRPSEPKPEPQKPEPVKPRAEPKRVEALKPPVSLVGIVTASGTRQAVLVGTRTTVVTDGAVIEGYRVSINPARRSVTLRRGSSAFELRLPE